MGDRFPTWNQLPVVFTGRCRAFYEPLGCLREPIEGLARGLADTAALYGVQDADALVPVVTSIAAAIHTSQSLSWPSVALPCDDQGKPPSPVEWLLLAALASSRSQLPAAVVFAIDAVVTSLGSTAPNAGDLTCTNEEPTVDYGMGMLLSSVTSSVELVVAGRAIGRLARLLAEIQAIMDPRLVAPRPILLLRIAADVGLGPRAAYAVACASKPVPDKLPLVCLFGAARIRDRVREITSEWLNEAVLLAQEKAMSPLQEFARLVGDSIANKAAGARLFGLFPSSYPPNSELDRTIALARDALEFDPELRSTWEVQRWGLWCQEPRIGRIFPVGICLLALYRTGHDPSARIERMIVDTRRSDGWRYYENWTDIPPDIDDLGLILRLFSCIRDGRIDREIFRRPFDLVRQAMAKDGQVPVWLYEGLDEPVSENAPNWLGPRCVAVAAQLILGMIEAHIDGHEDLQMRVVEWIVQSWENEQERAVYHYTWPFARLLLAKLAYAMETSGRLILHEQLRAIVSTIADEIERSVEGDGGWGSPLATGCHLAVLALCGRSFDPWPGLIYLASRQGPDGMWPAEPLYRCPGKDGALTAHGAAAITTAVCLDALFDVKAYLQRTS